MSVTLADTEDVWADIFAAQLGRPYDPRDPRALQGRDPKSPCGGASGATGPFYCPVDRKVYLDTDFFTTLERQLGARGDFAAAYVVAHEIAHHVQDELGILGKANEIRRQVERRPSPTRSRSGSSCRRTASRASGRGRRRSGSATIEPGDIEEAMNAAARRSATTRCSATRGGVPRPESFTHGTSEQRQRWLHAATAAATIPACDTFGAAASRIGAIFALSCRRLAA